MRINRDIGTFVFVSKWVDNDGIVKEVEQTKDLFFSRLSLYNIRQNNNDLEDVVYPDIRVKVYYTDAGFNKENLKYFFVGTAKYLITRIEQLYNQDWYIVEGTIEN